MLKPAIEYKEELQQKLIEACNQNNMSFSYYNTNYDIASINGGEKIEKNTMRKHQFVSVWNDEVIGYISYNISLEHYRVYNLKTINFTNNAMAFGLDIRTVIDNIFEIYKFRKINFGVFVGNPIEKSHDAITVRLGARIVGVHKQHCKLADGQYYDYKLYEMLREDYLSEKERRKLARMEKQTDKKIKALESDVDGENTNCQD